jgi:hypothetical protein
MSIFLNLIQNRIDDANELGRDFSQPPSVSTKALGNDVYSHMMYKELDEPVRHTTFGRGPFSNNRLFVIYRNWWDTIIIVRLDCHFEIRSRNLIVYDQLTVTTPSIYVDANVNYCIDQVISSEYHTTDEFNAAVADLRHLVLVAHGEWEYLPEGAIQYYGSHVKKQDFHCAKFEQSTFIMQHQTNFNKYQWSAEQVGTFKRL